MLLPCSLLWLLSPPVVATAPVYVTATATVTAHVAVSAGTTYIQAPMENLPVPDASLDAVVCVYCFHEMPESARLAAAQEWHRWMCWCMHVGATSRLS